jgi:HPr kinase/phosphorylase
MVQASVAQLFERHRESLQLAWISGARDSIIKTGLRGWTPADLVGFLNLIHPERIQVLGRAELVWARKHPAEKVLRLFQEIMEGQPPAVIVADGCEIPEDIRRICVEQDVPLITTPQPASIVIDQLRIYLGRALAERASLHGVLMDVLGIGVLITGDSGVGKSELALELISRGHGLVADDVVEIARVAPDLLEGRCPDMLRNFLEVRGLGVLNIRTVFGETACRRKMRLKLVVHLQRPVRGMPEATRLPLDAQIQDVLGVPLRRVTIPVAPGRNLAVLLETAVRSTILLLRGIDSTQEFVERQKSMLAGDK